LRIVTTSRFGPTPHRDHVAVRPDAERRPLVEGDERPQRRAAVRLEAVLVHGRVRGRRALARGRQQRGRNPGADERPLLADRPRERQARPLGHETRGAGVRRHFLADGRVDRPLQAQRRDLGAVGPARDDRPARAAAREVAEDEHGVDRVRAQPAREVARARRPAAAAARRDERDRPPQSPARDDPGELDHRRGARELRRRAAAGRVAVGDDHELGPRRADLAGEHRGQSALAVDRVALEARGRHLVGGAHPAERIGDPASERGVGRIAGAPLRIGAHETLQIAVRVLARERVRRERRPDRGRLILQ
jgi:hypothetical protein